MVFGLRNASIRIYIHWLVLCCTRIQCSISVSRTEIDPFKNLWFFCCSDQTFKFIYSNGDERSVFPNGTVDFMCHPESPSETVFPSHNSPIVSFETQSRSQMSPTPAELRNLESPSAHSQRNQLRGHRVVSRGPLTHSQIVVPFRDPKRPKSVPILGNSEWKNLNSTAHNQVSFEFQVMCTSPVWVMLNCVAFEASHSF